MYDLKCSTPGPAKLHSHWIKLELLLNFSSKCTQVHALVVSELIHKYLSQVLYCQALGIPCFLTGVLSIVLSDDNASCSIVSRCFQPPRAIRLTHTNVCVNQIALGG